MSQVRIILATIALLCCWTAKAQYTGSSYLGISVGGSTENLQSVAPAISLHYGYLLSEKLTIDASCSWRGVSEAELSGNHFTLNPAIYYSLYRSDKTRIDLGTIGSIGYESVNIPPSNSLVEVIGEPNSVTTGFGGGLRITRLLSSKLSLFGGYSYLYQSQSFSVHNHTLNIGVYLFL